MIKFIEKHDIKIYHYINSHKYKKGLDHFMRFFTFLGNLGMLWILLALLFILNRNLRREGIALICALVLTTMLGEGLIKHLVKRKRPFIKLNTIDNLIIRPPSSYSFPSGHTASSFAAATIFFAIDSRISILIAVVALIISFSRLYLNVHYFSDVIAGALLGTFCGSVTAYLFNIII